MCAVHPNLYSRTTDLAENVCLRILKERIKFSSEVLWVLFLKNMLHGKQMENTLIRYVYRFYYYETEVESSQFYF